MIDTIYRDDAIEAVRKIVPIETEIDATLLDKMDVIVELSELPSADAVHIETYRELYEKYVELKHASAETVQCDAISKRFISDAILQKISELNAQGEKAIPIAREFIRFKRFVDGITPIRAETVQGWIPCSERMPSESGTYLTTTAKGSVCTGHYYANSTDLDDRHWSYRSRREPIAWMPLPKPYKGGDDK